MYLIRNKQTNKIRNKTQKQKNITNNEKITTLINNKTIKNRIRFINKILKKELSISNITNTNNIPYPTTIMTKTQAPNDILSYLKKKEQLVELLSKKGTFGFPFMACTKNCKDKNTEKYAIKLIYFNKNSGEYQHVNIKKFMKKLESMNDKEKKDAIDKNGMIHTNFFLRLGDEFSPNVELKIINILKYLVQNNITPHINLPIIRFHSTLSLLKKKYTKSSSWSSNDNYFDDVNVLLSEWNEYGNLRDFLIKYHKTFENNSEKWIILFFQILYTLVVIQKKIPHFKHNDLHMKNILVDKIEKGYYLYRIRFNKSDKIINYRVKSMGFQIKLWDFDYSSIKNRVHNLKINKLSNISNRFNDLFLIFYKLFCFEKKTNSHTFRSKIGHFFNDILKYYQTDVHQQINTAPNNKTKNNKNEYIPLDTNICEGARAKHIWSMKNEREYITSEEILELHTKNKERGIFGHLIISDAEIKNYDFIEVYECI
jgi:hypothetical protein